MTLTAVDQAGKVLRSVTPESVPGDRIGSFVVLSDGFCVAWLPSYLASKDVTVGAGRVAVHSTDGAHLRSTWADLGALSYEGVVEWRADNNWEPRPKEPWVPRDIETAYWDPILVSRDRIAATFVEDRSGIGVTFFIATDTGDISSRTAPGPTGYNAVIGPGEFLLGHQGYGAFTTAHHNDRGKVVREWTTHAMLLIDRHGDIRGPESENITPSRSRFVTLEPNGTVTNGPPLSAYYTSFPAVDERGTTVFWRNGQLLAIEQDLTVRVLFEFPADEDYGPWPSNILLMSEGRVAFAMSGRVEARAESTDLVIVEDTGLGMLDSGVWPCMSGGLHGNPAVFA